MASVTTPVLQLQNVTQLEHGALKTDEKGNAARWMSLKSQRGSQLPAASWLERHTKRRQPQRNITVQSTVSVVPHSLSEGYKILLENYFFHRSGLCSSL